MNFFRPSPLRVMSRLTSHGSRRDHNRFGETFRGNLGRTVRRRGYATRTRRPSLKRRGINDMQTKTVVRNMCVEIGSGSLASATGASKQIKNARAYARAHACELRRTRISITSTVTGSTGRRRLLRTRTPLRQTVGVASRRVTLTFHSIHFHTRQLHCRAFRSVDECVHGRWPRSTWTTIVTIVVRRSAGRPFGGIDCRFSVRIHSCDD